MLAKRRRSKDSAVTVSVVIVQIFHERENKLRPFTWKKRKELAWNLKFALYSF